MLVLLLTLLHESADNLDDYTAEIQDTVRNEECPRQDIVDSRLDIVEDHNYSDIQRKY